jgi:hypothetical protein
MENLRATTTVQVKTGSVTLSKQLGTIVGAAVYRPWDLVFQGFTGTITIEATLDSDPDTAAWFDALAYGDASSVLTQSISESVVGNFTWLRAKVQTFDAGTINLVTATY